jgi:CheY-like chemotaxis protein
MEQQIQVSNRMFSIGTIAAGVAHEINNPLSGLIGNLFLLSELLTAEARPAAESRRRKAAGRPETPRPSALQTILREATEAAERVRGIVREIKLFSRGEEDVNLPVSIDKVLESSLRMTRNEVRHRARVVKTGQVKPLVMASESRLGQVFVNLMINAAHSIPEGHAEENEILVSVGLDPHGQVLVEIRDSGTGIPPEILPRIFEPFFTTKEVGVGTGLGLTICKRIVTEIGGTITVASKLGEGTTFRVSLPAYHLDPLEPKRPARARSLDQRRGRVLVIDDEPLVRLSIERVLTARHDVVSEARAEDALARLVRGEKFDVILCDVMMPQMTGIEFRDLLEAALPGQSERIVFMTAGALVGGTGRLIESVVNTVIEKPMDMHRLRALVAEFVALDPPAELQGPMAAPPRSPSAR